MFSIIIGSLAILMCLWYLISFDLKVSHMVSFMLGILFLLGLIIILDSLVHEMKLRNLKEKYGVVKIHKVHIISPILDVLEVELYGGHMVYMENGYSFQMNTFIDGPNELAGQE